MTSTSFVDISVGNVNLHLEYEWINRDLSRSPLVIFLHEGLGSLTMWRDYPKLLCERGNYRGLVYSRAGYGKSRENPAREKYDPDYLNHEAIEIFPALLKALKLKSENPILFGHSDGASIALIYAAIYPTKVSAVIALAPHIFVEDKALRESRLPGNFIANRI